MSAILAFKNISIMKGWETESPNITNYFFFKIREINLGLTKCYPTTVADLIEDFFKAEQLQNFNCSKYRLFDNLSNQFIFRCKQKRNATRTTFLLRAPSVLIIQLKRFNIYGGKNRLRVRALVGLFCHI